MAAALSQSADAIAAVLDGRASAVHSPVADLEAPAMLDLPDPFEQDLSPWLLRRLQLAVGISHQLRDEATQAIA